MRTRSTSPAWKTAAITRVRSEASHARGLSTPPLLFMALAALIQRTSQGRTEAQKAILLRRRVGRREGCTGALKHFVIQSRDHSGTQAPHHEGYTVCAHSAAPHMLHSSAGTLFWKWALSPKNPREDYLEVAVPDPTFTDIVVPGAKAALDWAKKASPAKNCEKVLFLPVYCCCR